MTAERSLAGPDGLVIVDKPAGLTSHDVVSRLRRRFATRKVGHAGTLDPDATGVLVAGVGRATRLLQFVIGLAKTYRGQVVLGVETDTLDAAGRVVATHDMSAVTLEQARAAGCAFLGEIDQIPPMVSAVKVGGKRLHELARRGVEIERQPRRVTVHRLEITQVEGEPGVLDIEVECSSGTYVRSLAADLGAALGGGAHLRGLRRLAVGSFTLAEAGDIDDAPLLPPLEALRGFEIAAVDRELATRAGHGQVLAATVLGVDGPGPWAVVGPEGSLVAVYQHHSEGRCKPTVVLAPNG